MSNSSRFLITSYVIPLSTAGGRKKRECGPSFRLSGVAINAKTTLQTLEDLEPLHKAMPADPKLRRHWRLEPPNGRSVVHCALGVLFC